MIGRSAYAREMDSKEAAQALEEARNECKPASPQAVPPEAVHRLSGVHLLLTAKRAMSHSATYRYNRTFRRGLAAVQSD